MTDLLEKDLDHDLPGFRGEVVSPGSPDYERARRVWNLAIDRRPRMVARCTGAADVIAAVRHARERGLPLAVRGGGHSIPGFSTCDDGIVVDLSGMKGIRVDPRSRTATAQPGLTWAEFDAETQAFGLATPGGEVSDTGIAGLTLGGGIGCLSRKFGLSCDNLLSADLVTADGRLLQVGPDEHPDLFWALRGGGGNFGIVTEFRFRVHPVGPMVAGPLMYPEDQAPAVLGALQDLALDAPREFALVAALATMPPLPEVPQPLQGRRTLVVIPCWVGSRSEGEAFLRGVRGIGRPVVDGVGITSYVALQRSADAMNPPGLHNYVRSDLLGRLDDAAIDRLIGQWAGVSSPRSVILLRLLGGAISDVDPRATAFVNRGGRWLVTVSSSWEGGPGDAHRRWARDTWTALRPAAAGTYVNHLDGDEGRARIKEAYGGSAGYQRLAAVKAAYDPDNVFRLNQNIEPLTSASI
ncbi:FAD-binding oxidoreductase [Geodermatophilus sp. SYSU D00697]